MKPVKYNKMPEKIAKLQRQKMRNPERLENLLRGKTAEWVWEKAVQFVSIGEDKIGSIAPVPGRLRPGRLRVIIWERDPKSPDGVRPLYARRYKATDENLRKLVNLVVTWVPGVCHWQKWELVSTHAIRAGWHPRLRKEDAGPPPTLLSKKYRV